MLPNELAAIPGEEWFLIRTLPFLEESLAQVLSERWRLPRLEGSQERLRKEVICAYTAVSRHLSRALTQIALDERLIHRVLDRDSQDDKWLPEHLLGHAKQRADLVKNLVIHLVVLLESMGEHLKMWLGSASTPSDVEEGIFRNLIPAMFAIEVPGLDAPIWLSSVGRVAAGIADAICPKLGQRGGDAWKRRLRLVLREAALPVLAHWLPSERRRSLF